MTTPHTTTIEQERKKDLEEYRQKTESKEESLRLVSDDKEEPSEYTEHDIAIAEAEAGKIKSC